jgi:hypothetical protein
MKLMSAFVGIALSLGVSAVNAAPPPPAKPPSGPLPLGARMKLLLDFENNISQVVGSEVVITSLRNYEEQDGTITMCIIGRTGGKKFKLVNLNGHTIEPTSAQWLDSGCTRPNYQLIR